MELNKIYNEDCLKFIPKLEDYSIDLVMTSPPYCSHETALDASVLETKTISKVRGYHHLYDTDIDVRTEEDYVDFTVNVFNSLESKLKENGVILWNVSYGMVGTNPSGLNNAVWRALLSIIEKTDFVIGDKIVWKKSNAIPVSEGNKLSRITEDIFVFCRRKEIKTYFINKNKKSEKQGHIYYTPIRNLIETGDKNNKCPYNRATYPVELCTKLFDLYAPKNGLVYDPFMGSGTTAIACIEKGLNYLGTELSVNQVEWANNRIKEFKGNSLWFK